MQDEETKSSLHEATPASEHRAKRAESFPMIERAVSERAMRSRGCDVPKDLVLGNQPRIEIDRALCNMRIWCRHHDAFLRERCAKGSDAHPMIERAFAEWQCLDKPVSSNRSLFLRGALSNSAQTIGGRNTWPTARCSSIATFESPLKNEIQLEVSTTTAFTGSIEVDVQLKLSLESQRALQRARTLDQPKPFDERFGDSLSRHATGFV